MESLIGIIGGAIFYFSWLVQTWETRKYGKPTFNKKFFIIRIIASFILLYEAIRVNSIGFILVYVGTVWMMFYNIYMLRPGAKRKKKGKGGLLDLLLPSR